MGGGGDFETSVNYVIGFAAVVEPIAAFSSRDFVFVVVV